jgi:hypothetical protein
MAVRKKKFFSSAERRNHFYDHTQRSVKWVADLNRSGPEADHLLQSRVEAKYAWTPTSTVPYDFILCVVSLRVLLRYIMNSKQIFGKILIRERQ